MKEKGQEQEYTMLNKTSEQKNKPNKKKKNNNFEYFYEIINAISFSSLFILSWFSLKWLAIYQNIFTIHRYINYGFSIYFPIQVSSPFLYIINFLIIIIITISYIYYIINFIINILRKDYNEEDYEYNNNNKLPKIILFSLLLNSILFLLAKIIKENYTNSHIFFCLGLILCLISLFLLLKINFEKKLYNNLKIDNDANFIEIIFKEFFFEILLAIDLYYCFYVICQIISYFINNLEIQNFLGIIANLCLGIVCLYINFQLKSIGNSLFFGLVFLGILNFQFTIRTQEREEIKLGYGEAILSAIFFLGFIIELIYIIFYKMVNSSSFN